MPKALLDFMGYCIYFWSNENNEPIHVHISKGVQTENATKFWITRENIELVHTQQPSPKGEGLFIGGLNRRLKAKRLKVGGFKPRARFAAHFVWAKAA